MKTFKVTIYPVTPWITHVEAENEEEAKEIALGLEGPETPSFHGSSLNEWEHDIMEWPNIGNGTVDVEEY